MPDILRDSVVLIGYMDEKSARDFLTNDCVLEKSPDQVTDLIRRCSGAVSRLPPPDLEAEVRSPPAEVDGLLSLIGRDERLPKVVKGLKWSFKEVEIDRIVSTQKYVDAAYAGEISSKLDLGTIEGRVRFCLTDAFRIRDSQLVNVPSALTFAVKGTGPDLRVTGQESAFDPRTGDLTVSFTVGWGHPFIQVVHLRGRYILKNGYHRAFALRNRGIEHLPCILIEASDYDDLESAGPPTFFDEDLVMGERPPTLASFFDPEVGPHVKMRSYSKAVIIRPDSVLLDPDSLSKYLTNERVAPARSGSDTLEYVDVRATREEWNVYRLPDGTLLKMRAVVTRMVRPKPGETRGSPDISNVVLVCNPPKDKKGPPLLTRPRPEELTSAIVDPDVRFEVVSEPVNEYVTDDGKRVLMKLRLYTLARTSKYDPRGDPIYLYNAHPEVTISDL